MDSNERKLKIVHRVGGVVLFALFLMITFPPIVELFDRNDIWLGGFPLSQVYVFMIPFLGALTLMVMYQFDKKYSKEEGGNE